MASKVEHGTNSGYTYHYKHWKTPPCAACKAAKADFYALQGEAHSAALSRLRRMQPTLWKQLYAEEKAKRGL